MNARALRFSLGLWLLAAWGGVAVRAQAPAPAPAPPAKPPPPAWTAPALPNGAAVVTHTAPEFLVPPETLKPAFDRGEFAVARTAPTVDFLFCPGQTYKGNPWSDWGNGYVANGKYYTAIGDHEWRAYVYEYDPATKQVRTLVDLKEFLNQPEGFYTPGKVHSFVTLAKDGWLYFATHNGGRARLSPPYQYQGDWILRTNPASGQTEVVCQGPVGADSVPTGFLDPDRLIFYGGSEKDLLFFAYDTQAKKLLYQSLPNDGPSRNMLFARSTGRVYYRAHTKEGRLRRYDPATNTATEVVGDLDPRCSSSETADGFIYAVDWVGDLWRFNTKTEQSERLTHASIGPLTYTTTLPIDATGRYVYYSGGAHGSADKEGTAIVQLDTRTLKRKVIAFLTPFYTNTLKYSCTGTYSMCLSADGGTLFATWNGARVGVAGGFDVCAITAIHIPAAERPTDPAPAGK